MSYGAARHQMTRNPRKIYVNKHHTKNACLRLNEMREEDNFTYFSNIDVHQHELKIHSNAGTNPV